MFSGDPQGRAGELRIVEFGWRNGDLEQESRFDLLASGEKEYWPNEPTASQNPGRVGDAMGVTSSGIQGVHGVSRMWCPTQADAGDGLVTSADAA